MNFGNILIGLMPMIGWGIFPVLVGKIGGKPVNQIIGTTYGTLVFAVITAMFTGAWFPNDTKTLVFSIISGACWATAQIITFYVFTLMGVSRTMPITTGFQLIGASLFAVLFRGSWATSQAKLIGFSAMILIIIGVYLTAWSEKKETGSAKKGVMKGIIFLLIGEIGYLGYSAFPQSVNADGMHAFLPQAIGMAIAGTIYGLYITFSPKEKPFAERTSYMNIISGFFFAFAALTLLISMQTSVNGMATGFVLSQTSAIVATLGGIYILKEKKTNKEMTAVIIGLLLIVIAGSATAFIK
ncbi:putative ribose uptake protein RbsU [Companilactobacillus sp. RD055328]|uniref:ribose/proton symporter RbsU n=1 Tax=Companilactobacillus sp. RD055328 TaxID=2916634 RepID=UPI001FC7E8CC|nr:ribose transporter RbsU [Companilactobacillus sp. RD055328]GKQ42708.1 putative ribose uptake protein RbsU [Companilactobacillus sp. RD055328]